MSDGIWLGLDLGTQGVRALAVGPKGTVLARASRPLASRRDGSRHEQDPEDWWRAVTEACRAMTASLPSAPVSSTSLLAVAVCATSGTITLVDDAGHPLTPGLMYDDSRAGAEAARANEVGAATWSSLGYRIGPSWALPKLMWLLRDLRERGDPVADARLAHQADFVTRRLIGGKVPADSSHALKSGYDLLHDAWPAEVMDALAVPESMLPTVVRPGAELGLVGRAGAEATGIPAGTPVIAGMTDGCAAQIASGALEVGDWSSDLGTTLTLKGVTADLIRDPQGAVYSHRAPGGRWLPGGASSVGAGVLSEHFPGRSLPDLDRRAAEREPAGVLAYPLVSRGERFPFSVPEAEGFVLGAPSDEADHFAALLQGVAYVERLCLDYLDRLGAPTAGELSLTGGATRSRYWCQLRADVLGREVTLVEEAEPAFGMAVLAASGERGLAATAAEMVRVREHIAPRADRARRFHEPYVRLVDELERRGWLEESVAAHTRARARAAR